MTLKKLPPVGAAVALLFNVGHHWRGTTQAERCCYAY